MRNLTFTTGEYYHIFNRGNNKRDIFLDSYDLSRFLLSMQEFNTQQPIGSIFEHAFEKEKSNATPQLVYPICYCLNPNHFHFILKQLTDDGIVKFMHRLGTGYTKYFNHKYKNNGSLFQGVFKAKHIDSNEYLLHLSSYINLNGEVHKIGSFASKSSWDEYLNPKNSGICDKEIILSQFKNRLDYKKFAADSLRTIKEHKEFENP